MGFLSLDAFAAATRRRDKPQQICCCPGRAWRWQTRDLVPISADDTNDTTDPTPATASLHRPTHSLHPWLLSNCLEPSAIYFLEGNNAGPHSTHVLLCCKVPARHRDSSTRRWDWAVLISHDSSQTASSRALRSALPELPPRLSPGFATLSLGRWLRPSAVLGVSRADRA